jgi:hypothetical protein
MEFFFSCVESLGRYYRDSPARTNSLKAFLSRFGKKIVCSAFTRWLSHDRTIQAIDESFEAVIKGLWYDLRDRKDAGSQGPLTWLCTREFVAVLAIQRDILPNLAMFSKVLQREGGAVDLHLFQTQFEALIASIDRQLEVKEGVRGSNFAAYPQRIEALRRLVIITLYVFILNFLRFVMSQIYEHQCTGKAST